MHENANSGWMYGESNTLRMREDDESKIVGEGNEGSSRKHFEWF